MWIFMSGSFLSIVRDKHNPENLLVRARAKDEIKSVFGVAETYTPDADYHYRASIPENDVAQVIAKSIREIDYGNFKNTVRDSTRHHAYMDVWSTMASYQNRKAHRGNPRDRF
jgi:hypothetical protein